MLARPFESPLRFCWHLALINYSWLITLWLLVWNRLTCLLFLEWSFVCQLNEIFEETFGLWLFLNTEFYCSSGDINYNFCAEGERASVVQVLQDFLAMVSLGSFR